MIDEIQVQNLALIREATLQPSHGLTVITGETGAGKTALLSALKLLMGARASADLVRDGENGLTVAGRFFGLGGLASLDVVSAGEGGSLDADSPFDGEGEAVIVRTVSGEGRSRASVNGAMASARELASLVAPSVDLCGQFEHQQLMRPATHLSLLDAWAGEGVSAAREAYDAAFAQAAEAAENLERVRMAQELSSTQLDEARFVLKRIDEVDPREGEYEQLVQSLDLAEHAEALATATATARAALADDAGALDALNTAASELESAGRYDAELAAMAESLREAGFILEDIAAQARQYHDKLEFDAEDLAVQQERLSLMKGLLRSYGPRMEDVLARREEALELVSLVDDSAIRMHKAQEALDEAERNLAAAADALDAARAEAAPRFAAEVTAVMKRLQMQGARLDCRLDRLSRDSWSASGPSSFEFLYQPTESSHPRPLARIASGGEVSRVMLAIKVVLGKDDEVHTLVFDEVDAGVGGSVAVSLAGEIAQLAQTHQVIVVTHLAQVAVRGDTHYVVKRSGDETRIEQVQGDDRIAEIARMLSGSATDTSLAHARELLSGAVS